LNPVHLFRYWAVFNFLCMGIIACGAIQYRWYTPDLPDECYAQGKLLGKEGKDGWADLSMEECKPVASPSPGPRARCAVQLLSDFRSAEKELLECRQALSDCQKGAPPQ
jgi:hypothetical protein